MHIPSIFAGIVAVATLAGASPLNVERDGGDEDTVVALGGGVPNNPGRPGPISPDQCFYARVVDGRPGVVGKWLDGHHEGLIHLHKNPKQADLWALDRWGQLRLAYEGSVVWRDPILKKPYGPAKTRSKGAKKYDDKITCNVNKDGILRCEAAKGDQTLSHLDHYLYIGQSPAQTKWSPWHPWKRNLVPEPCKIETYPAPCPGNKGWSSWN